MMNNFRIAGDIIRFIAVIALPIKLWTSKSAAGVSGKTQILYALVCTSRYVDLFLYHIVGLVRKGTFPHLADDIFISPYNTAFKILFVAVAYLTVYLIYGKLKDTYSRNEDSFKIGYLVSAAAVLAVIFNYGWSGTIITYPEVLDGGFSFLETSWAFSQYLEAVAIVPQLLMVYQDKTNETKSFIFYYLYALGLYRALYAMNWVYKYHAQHFTDVISDSAGFVQLTIYVVFAFVYVMRESPYSKIVDRPVIVNI